MVSATYIFNDIRDADQDIQHPEKKNRPIASGTISKNIATKYGLTLLFLSFIACLFNPETINNLLFYLFNNHYFVFNKVQI